MADLPIQVVDEHDKPIGKATKQEVWSEGLWHRVVRIMVVDRQRRVLLQKRSPSKQPHPNCWDTAAAGHVDAGEDYMQAAQREFFEELGIKTTDLEEIDSYKTESQVEWRKLKRFAKIYRVRLDATPMQLEKEDISEVRWFTPAEVRALVTEHPEQTTDGLRKVIERNPGLL